MTPTFNLALSVLTLLTLSECQSDDFTADWSTNNDAIKEIFGNQLDGIPIIVDFSDVSYEKKYIFSNVSANWYKARELCETFGYQFASIESQAELQLFKDNFNASGIERSVWIGATDMAEEEKFVWPSLPPRPLVFSNWFDGEPNNAGDNENCIYSFYGVEKYNFQWNDYLCESRLYFACQTPKYETCETSRPLHQRNLCM